MISFPPTCFRKLTKANSTGYNPIVEIAKETRTPLHLWKESTILVDSDGHVVNSVEANNALKQVWELLERARDHSTQHSHELEPSASLYEFFQASCARALERGDMTRRQVELVLGMSHMWGAYVGDQVERQSLKFFYLEDCIEGGRYETRMHARQANVWRRLLHTNQLQEHNGQHICAASR